MRCLPYVAELTASFAVEPAQTISPSLKGCIPVAANNILFVDFILLMVFETSKPWIKYAYRDIVR